MYFSQGKLYFIFSIPLSIPCHIKVIEKPNDNFDPFSEIISFNKEQVNILQRSWKLSYFDGNTVAYGPVSTNYVFMFLQNIFSKFSAIEKRNTNLMVIDVNTDVHYGPDELYQTLKNEYQKRSVLNINNLGIENKAEKKPFIFYKEKAISKPKKENKENSSFAGNIFKTEMKKLSKTKTGVYLNPKLDKIELLKKSQVKSLEGK